jgi:hypothetical protein
MRVGYLVPGNEGSYTNLGSWGEGGGRNFSPKNKIQVLAWVEFTGRFFLVNWSSALV